VPPCSPGKPPASVRPYTISKTRHNHPTPLPL
jgi:hypothetical protein